MDKAQIHEYRMLYSRNHQIVLQDDELGVLVIAINGPKFHSIGWYGRQKNPHFNYVHLSQEAMNKFIAEWYQHLKDSAKARKAKKEFEKQAPNPYKVGDVLYAMWGYDQTNINLYQVVRLVGNKSVAIREIAREREYTESMSGVCVPIVGEFVGDEMVKRVDVYGGVKIDSVRKAYALKHTEVAGIRVYESLTFSEYA